MSQTTYPKYFNKSITVYQLCFPRDLICMSTYKLLHGLCYQVSSS